MAEPNQEPASLSDLIQLVDTPKGRARLEALLDSEPYPHFEAHPTVKRALIRIDADGTQTAGRFIDREFVRLEDLGLHVAGADEIPE
jgi:hypothetical protein